MRAKKHTVTALLLSASLLCAGCRDGNRIYWPAGYTDRSLS